MAVKKVNETEVMKRAKERFKIALSAWNETYDEMVADLEFVNGDQWPAHIKQQREADNRPCLRINKLPQFVDRVLGDMRQARPSIKIRPVDDKADDETADVIGGIVRNIETQSDAEIVYDTGGEAMVRCGLGAWRVLTSYIGPDSFDQEIRLDRIVNQFGVLFDPSARKWARDDGRFQFVYEDMPRETFKQTWKNARQTPWSSERDKKSDWHTEKTIRVAEYFEKEMETSKLYLIAVADDPKPQTVTELPKTEHRILKERTVKSEKIIWYRLSGEEILEGPREISGKYFPVIPVWGKELAIRGKCYYNGVVRHAKDSMRLYNYFRSMDAETIALAPKAPWIMTAKMIGPYKNQWKEANTRNFPYLLYKPDPDAPTAKPERNIPQLANQAVIQNIMVADQELHDTTGLQLASLGKKSNEQSGRAIEARAKEGDIGQFTYVSNLTRAIKHTAKVIVGMMPYIYDTARVQRIIGEDNNQKSVQINQQFKDEKSGTDKVFDLTVGRYDVVASVGPSYETQRQESLAAMVDFAGILDPPQRAVIADQIAETSDWHGKDEIARRLKKLLPDGMVEPDEGEEPPQPTEAEQRQAAMAEAQMEAEMEKLEVELATMKEEKLKAEAETAKAEAEAAIAEAKAAHIAKHGYQEVVDRAK